MGNNRLEEINQHIVVLETTLLETKNNWLRLYNEFKDSDPTLAERFLANYNEVNEKLVNYDLLSEMSYSIVPTTVDTMLYGGKAVSIIRWFRNSRNPTMADFVSFWESVNSSKVPANIMAILKPMNIPSMAIPPSLISSIVYTLYAESMGELINVK